MTEFEVEEIFHIKGRGPAVSRNNDTSRRLYTEGQRWEPGDIAHCGDLTAKVLGVERFCVLPSHPSYFDGALLLGDVDENLIEVGQVWIKDETSG